MAEMNEAGNDIPTNPGASSPDAETLAELKKEEANKFFAEKDYKRALIGYNEAIELCPDVAKYYANRSACYMMLSDYRNALKDAQKTIELDPNSLKAHIRHLKCSLILGDIINATSLVNKIEDIDPTGTSITNEKRDLENLKNIINEAEIAYGAKDYRKVVYCMKRCSYISTNCPGFKIKRAECLALLGRYQEAQDIVNDILHIDKQNVDAIYVRGYCLYYEDNIRKAISHFQQVLRLAPDHDKALKIYKRAKSSLQKRDEGNAAYREDKLEEANKLYTEALLVDPQNRITNSRLHFNKAIIAKRLGRLNESLNECTEALKLDETYVKAYLRRAQYYMDLEQYENAVHDYEAAFKLDKCRGTKRLLDNAKQALEKSLKKSLKKDYYKVLGINKTASVDDIKKAYRKKAMIHHPDRHANATDGEKKEQEKKFKEIGEAYGILSDPKKRFRYNNGQDINDDEEEMTHNTMFQTYFARRAGGAAAEFSYFM